MPTVRTSRLGRAAMTATVVMCIALALSAAAQAVTPQQRLYDIFIHQYRAELAYTTAHMQGNLAAEQPRLATTASSIDALSSTHGSAATALIDELENQYYTVGAEPLFKASLASFEALATVPLTSAQHHEVILDEAYDRRALRINTAADLAQWQSSNFATGSEPVATTQFGGILGIRLPSIDLAISGTTAAIKTFTTLESKANAKVTSVFNTVSDSWSSWIARFGVQSG